MTREYAAIQLLRHGPLTLERFHWYTCWPTMAECKAVLAECQRKKTVKKVKQKKGGAVIFEAVA